MRVLYDELYEYYSTYYAILLRMIRRIIRSMLYYVFVLANLGADTMRAADVVCVRVRVCAQENASLQTELEYEFVDDGTFWIEYGDFVREFNKLFVCRLFPPSWHQLTIKGAWVGKTAGGSPFQKGRISGTWCNNPQYHLTVTRSCEMVISLMQVRPLQTPSRPPLDPL
eukprot:198749-Prorocentrum_minimum.AAC.2